MCSSDLLLAWLADDLAPRMAARYGADLHPRSVMVGGSSLGGLAALYAHLRRPERFGGALAMSPSLWVSRRAAFDHLRRTRLAPWSRVYIDAGRRESRGIAERDAGMAAALLRTLDGESVLFRADPTGRHREAVWKRRLPAALRFFYGTSRAPRTTP